MDMNEKTKKPRGIEPLWSQYIHAKASARGIPLSGNFELTSRCNFNCRMCYVHQTVRAEEEWTAREWLELGRVARDAGMVFLLLTGGEPLIRKDFREIYSGLKKLGLLISINTNASLIDPDWVAFFKKDPPLRMNISLYGASNETYRALCGQGSFHTVATNIRMLREAGIQVRLNASVTPINAKDVPEIYRFARENDLVVKGTAYMFPPSRINGGAYGEAACRFTAEEAAAHTLLCREQYMDPEQIRDMVPTEPHDPTEDCTDGQGERMNCRAGKTNFWVTWDGRMLPCGMFPTEGYDLKRMSFAEAWEAIRRDTAAILLPAACRECALRAQCPLCAAACLSETGRTDIRPEYICRMTHELAEAIRKKYPLKEDCYEGE